VIAALVVVILLLCGLVAYLIHAARENARLLDQSVPFDKVSGMLEHEAKLREQLLDRLMVLQDENGYQLSLYKSEQGNGGFRTDYVDEEREYELERQRSESGPEEDER
jgi:hypothetical protein